METQNQQTAPNSEPGKKFLVQVEEFFDTYLNKKAPFHLPHNAKETLVKVSPWISLVLALIGLQAVLVLFRFNMFVSQYAWIAHTYFGPGYYISIALSAVTVVMYVMAFSGLQKRTINGWRLLFYAALVAFVSGVISMNLVGAVIGIIINMYLLFQIKEMYK